MLVGWYSSPAKAITKTSTLMLENPIIRFFGDAISLW